MLEDSSSLFHIIVTHKDGGVIHRQTGVATITIGSEADIVLKNGRLLPVHLRVLVLNAREVLLFNLGTSDSVLLDAQEVEERAATTWQPGHTVILGEEYNLQLVAVGVSAAGTASAPQEQDDWLDTQAELAEETQQESPQLAGNAVPEQGQETIRTAPPPLPEEALPGPPLPPGPQFPFAADATSPEFMAAAPSPADRISELAWTRTQPEAVPTATTPEEPAAPAPGPLLQPQQPPPKPAAVFPQANVTEPEPGQAVVSAETRPAQPFLPGQDVFGPLDDAFFNLPYPAASEHTLYKAWQSAGLLSAQLPISPVNVAPGERIRVPVSVRNQHNQPVILQAMLLGLPEGWTIITLPRLKLDAQEVGALDLILQAHPGILPGRLEAVVRLVEVATPTISISLPFSIIVKSAPDIAGVLDPPRIRDSGFAYIRLQNHTQSEARIYLSGHNESRRFHTLPDQRWLDLPAGQSAQVKISIAVRKRPWIRGIRRQFSVSAKQGSRAPLDYAGTVYIHSHIPLWFFLWLLVATGVLLVALVTSGSIPLPPGLGGQEQPRPNASPTTRTEPAETPPGLSPPILIPAIPAQTEEVTGEMIVTTEEVAPTSTVPPAPMPFADPRPTTCRVGIPPGWMPYTVRRGDTVFRLAQRRDTSIAEIVRINCLPSSRQIRTGQVLLLPMVGD